ncbi:MAG: hypothetical protein NTV69_01845 [Caldilinea sp.]|nr:hypothetical protein [Caldilinea sp.]
MYPTEEGGLQPFILFGMAAGLTNRVKENTILDISPQKVGNASLTVKSKKFVIPAAALELLSSNTTTAHILNNQPRKP